MGNGQWAMGNGQWAMGNGQWAMGNGFSVAQDLVFTIDNSPFTMLKFTSGLAHWFALCYFAPGFSSKL